MQDDAHDNAAPFSAPQMMEAALARLAQRAASSAGHFRFFLYAAIGIPPGLQVFPAVESGNWSNFYWALAFALLLALTALQLRAWRMRGGDETP